MEKIRIENNWCHLTFYIGDEQIGTDVKKLNIKFPDGSTEIKEIIWTNEGYSYGDMGHTYSGSSDIPNIKINVKGLDILHPLDKTMEAEKVA